MSDALYYIWLSQILGEGNRVFPELLLHFGDPYELFRAEDDELYKVAGVDDEIYKKLMNKDLDCASRIADYCALNNIGILTYGGKFYPDRLKQLRDPPAVLYYKGKLPDFNSRVCVAMVGTRRMTDYGRLSAYKIAYELASAGAVVVSGMARGIDGISSGGALAAGGTTVAVLGSGIDVVYPKEHSALMEYIIAHGGVVMSEYAPGVEPTKFSFPMRNRIISGLCQGTLVVEADHKSGALITARDAFYQGRDVYALPGNVGTQNAEGPNGLIKDGAKMITTAEDILEEYAFLYSSALDMEKLKLSEGVSDYNDEFISKLHITCESYGKPTGLSSYDQKKTIMDVSGIKRRSQNDGANEKSASLSAHQRVSKPAQSGLLNYKPAFEDDAEKTEETKGSGKYSGLDETERRVMTAMQFGKAVTADSIAGSGIPICDVLTSLTMLEIKGLVSALPGGLYIRK